MNNTKDSIERKRIISTPAISVSKILNAIGKNASFF